MAKTTREAGNSEERRGLRRGSSGVADYESATADIIKRAITTAATVGGALRFGYTSDGGAYAIGIYGDGKPYTEYVSPHQDIDITLNLIIELFEAIADDLATAKKGKKTA